MSMTPMRPGTGTREEKATTGPTNTAIITVTAISISEKVTR